MKIEVTSPAVSWFREHVGIPVDHPEAGIRFKTKIYASSPVNPGFGLAIESSAPHEPIAEFTAEDLRFFVEKSDEWFFDGHDLRVDYDVENDEPKYIYLKDGSPIEEG